MKKSPKSLELKARCPYNNLAHEVCVNPQCSRFNPFICNNLCKDSMCYTNHKGCRFISWANCRKKLTTTSFNKDEQLQEFVTEVDELYDRLIGMIEHERQMFMVWHVTLGLNPKIAKFLDDIAAGRYAKLSGSQLCQLLKQGNPASNNVIIKNLTKVDNLYFKEIQRCMQQTLDMVKNIYDRPTIKQYNIKADPKDRPASIYDKNRVDDHFYDKNKHLVVQIESRIHNEDLDLRDVFTQDQNIRLLHFVRTANLKQLILTDNQLKSLEYLPDVRLVNIQQLYLDYNRIVDISPLIKCHLQRLQTLKLQYNQIADIAPLVKCNFPILKILHLNYNQIKSIEPIPYMRFPILHTLLLYDNNISQLDPLMRMDFPLLHILHIYANKVNPSTIADYSNKILNKFKITNVKLVI